MEQARKVPRIMIVDDDPDTVSILALHLRHGGFDPIQAASGAECLRLAEEEAVDVILLDLMMPGMDGFDVCRALRDNRSTAEIPIIMITARNDLDVRAEALRLGISDFLSKPVFRRQLASRIGAQLDMLATRRAKETLALVRPNGNEKKVIER